MNASECNLTGKILTPVTDKSGQTVYINRVIIVKKHYYSQIEYAELKKPT